MKSDNQPGMIQTSATRFKTNLGKYMRAIREGHEVVITDRGEPVARFVSLREPGMMAEGEQKVSHTRDPIAPPLGQVEIRPISHRGRPSTAILAEDRESR